MIQVTGHRSHRTLTAHVHKVSSSQCIQKRPNLLEDEKMKQESKDEFYEIISTEY